MDEGHQVHPLVLGLVQERLDPAAIAFQATQGAQVLQCTADHARYGSDRFQHDRAMAIPSGEKDVCEEPQGPGHRERDAVGQILRRVVFIGRRRIRHRNGFARLHQPQGWNRRTSGQEAGGQGTV